jgi:LysM repeat protein
VISIVTGFAGPADVLAKLESDFSPDGSPLLPWNQIPQSNCQSSQDTPFHDSLKKLPGSLNALYSLIRLKAPSARVIVVGYPHFFPKGGAAFPCWGFSTKDQKWANGIADDLNDEVRKATTAHGFDFINPNDPSSHTFAGHELCSGSRFVNGLFDVSPIFNPLYHAAFIMHPNASGQAAYCGLISDKLGVAASSCTSATPTLTSTTTSTSQAPVTHNAVAPAAQHAGATYLVASGDSLSKIGARLGVPWRRIYQANRGLIGPNPNLIRPGVALTIQA